MPHISIVSPIYNEASATISTLVDTLVHALAEITDDYEIILVDDGSRNDAWELICAMSTENSSVKGIRLARNFGQHSAIAAGLDHTSGDWVVVMDSDLQDRPEVIPELYRTAENGHDVVFEIEGPDRKASDIDFLPRRSQQSLQFPGWPGISAKAGKFFNHQPQCRRCAQLGARS